MLGALISNGFTLTAPSVILCFLLPSAPSQLGLLHSFNILFKSQFLEASLK